MCIRVSSKQIWMAKVHLPRSTAEDAFQSPLAILPLMGGGSGIVWREVGPPPVLSTIMSHFPLCHLHST
jgi:hypothetical protein